MSASMKDNSRYPFVDSHSKRACFDRFNTQGGFSGGGNGHPIFAGNEGESKGNATGG